jgi:hypothetical protein
MEMANEWDNCFSFSSGSSDFYQGIAIFKVALDTPDGQV